MKPATRISRRPASRKVRAPYYFTKEGKRMLALLEREQETRAALDASDYDIDSDDPVPASHEKAQKAWWKASDDASKVAKRMLERYGDRLHPLGKRGAARKRLQPRPTHGDVLTLALAANYGPSGNFPTSAAVLKLAGLGRLL